MIFYPLTLMSAPFEGVAPYPATLVRNVAKLQLSVHCFFKNLCSYRSRNTGIPINPMMGATFLKTSGGQFCYEPIRFNSAFHLFYVS